ncbi:ThuA domain-containing protein [Halieaceae bacterium IMCC8485]|uniref:ThuA domain-containing protein n=1 Tax=Candidatus Seongchinamella marina TaxID=2518990 RepID=A0ABT3SR02_9GAMM|nr:ThuA domain-containing protein [Candidatus Seongchinamella marina]MCX2972375.1 ThuA domain-containing protein [Candidatus Seongchinamella marina]
MSFIDYQSSTDVLVMTKGHPFDRDAFFAAFDSFSDLSYCSVEYPASQAFFSPGLAADFRTFVFYDMPGMDFQSPDPADGLAPRLIEPPAKFKQDFLDLVEKGHGFVFLHHALAAWPAWPEYAELVGGQFLYKPGLVRGSPCPDSGYRHEVSHTLTVETDHPVTRGLPKQFSLTDEVYLAHAFDDDVIALLSSDYEYHQDNFYSAQEAVQGRLYSRQGWQHSEGTHLGAWVRRQGNSPIVYLQCGDGPETYADPNFRRLLANAIAWVSSEEAREWARSD